jgi:hypothetical protein
MLTNRLRRTGKLQIVTMNRREKILVGIAAAAVIAGALVSFSGSPSDTGRSTQQEKRDIAEWAAAVRQSVARADAGRLQTRTLQAAEKTWDRDPFYHRHVKAKADAGSQTASRPGFSYTGYLEYGETSLAVINGMEYAPGDRLQAGNFVLERATPQKVVIQGRHGTFTVPFESEESPDGARREK